MVVAALSEELALLSAGSRRVLQGASVAGDPFEPELAAAASDVGEPEAMEAIDELLSAELIRPTSVPRRFGFRHPIVRRAVYEASPAAWRIGAHERVAQALADRGAGALARAQHIDASAKVGDTAAVATLAEAGRQSAQRAPATAARWFSGALRLLPETAPAEQRVELLSAAATALAATGRFAEAHEALVESLGLVDADATALRVQLVAACARVEHLLGRHEQAHERLAAALEDLPDAAGAAAVSLMLELAADEVYRLRYEAGQAWAQQAVDAAKAIGDPALQAAALATLARAFSWGGEPTRGEQVRAEATAILDTLTDEQLAGRLDAAVELAGAEIYLDRFVEAAAHAERALAVGRATGQGQLFPGVYATLGVALCMVGRLADAAELLDAAIEAARLSGHPPALAWALFCRAFVAVPAGDLKTAIAAAQESLELATEANQAVIAARAASILAVALLDAGQPDRAAAVLAGAAGRRAVRRHPRRLAGLSARADDPLLAGPRPPRGSTGRRCRRAGQRRGGRTALGNSDGLPRDRSRRPGRRRRRHSRTAGAASGRSRRRRRHAGRGRPGPHHRRPGAGRARRQRPRASASSNWQPPRSTAAAPCATATPRSAHCASSASTSTGARGRATQPAA